MTSPLARKEGLLSLAAESQRRNGKLPDTRTDDAIWSGVLADMEKKANEPKSPTILDRNPARSAAEVLLQGGAELLSGTAARRALRRTAPKRQRKRTPEAELACRRLRTLSLMPEWQRRVIAAMDEGARQALTMGGSMKLLIWLEVRKVLDASNALLGRWDRLPEKKIVTSGAAR